LPAPVFAALEKAPLICIVEPIERRAEAIYAEYVLDSPLGPKVYEDLKSSTRTIARRLGGTRTQEILADLDAAERGTDDLAWIRKLLLWYYDPFYADHLKRHEARIAFCGSFAECRAHLDLLVPNVQIIAHGPN
jgi:tRNA 2-selenouridine synthase